VPSAERAAITKALYADAYKALPQFALAWVLRESNVASAIIGA
jgi:aryl-alcohol dehydrogenase-like predicted oxidoreductase